MGCSNSEHKKAPKNKKEPESINLDSILPFSVQNDLYDIKLPDSVTVAINRDQNNNVTYCGVQYTSDSLIVAALSKKMDTINSIDFIINAKRIHAEFKSKLVMRLGEIRITSDSVLTLSKQSINGVLKGQIDDELDFIHFYSMDTSFIHQLHFQYDSSCEKYKDYIKKSYLIKK